MKILGYIETTDVSASGSLIFHPVGAPYSGSVGEGVIYYDGVTNQLMYSNNGGTPTPIGSGSGGGTGSRAFSLMMMGR